MIRRLGRCCTAALVCLVAIAAAVAQESPASSAPATSTASTFPASAPATTTLSSGGTIGSTTPPIGAPPGATVLFDGEKTEAWTTRDGKPCPWPVADDESMVATAADIISKETFEDFQLHVEFWLPKYPPNVTGQARGNSGVYLMGRYEIQVLDSFQIPAEKHGCGAIYGKKKPKENACTPPETWQSYDIKFTAPRFDADGKKIKNARVHVIHNGVTIHDDAEVDSPTRASLADDEVPGPGPIMLQYHGNPVRFRNVYVIPAKPHEKVGKDKDKEQGAPTTRPAAVRPAL